MKKMYVRGLILISVLLVLGSCKKDGSSATAADANPVLLLDAGAEPQALLRYKIAEGTTTKSNMDFWRRPPTPRRLRLCRASGFTSSRGLPWRPSAE